jgi:hypothetical protein
MDEVFAQTNRSPISSASVPALPQTHGDTCRENRRQRWREFLGLCGLSKMPWDPADLRADDCEIETAE